MTKWWQRGSIKTKRGKCGKLFHILAGGFNHLGVYAYIGHGKYTFISHGNRVSDDVINIREAVPNTAPWCDLPKVSQPPWWLESPSEMFPNLGKVYVVFSKLVPNGVLAMLAQIGSGVFTFVGIPSGIAIDIESIYNVIEVPEIRKYINPKIAETA